MTKRLTDQQIVDCMAMAACPGMPPCREHADAARKMFDWLKKEGLMYLPPAEPVKAPHLSVVKGAPDGY